VECSPSISPEYEGTGGEKINLDLGKTITNIFNNCLDRKKLCLIPQKSCLIVYVDALVLDFGGNLIDAISIAIRAALYDTKIPKLAVVEGEVEIASDDPHEYDKFTFDNVPISVTLFKIGSRFVVDASVEEEFCTGAHLVVGVNKKGNIVATQMGRDSRDRPHRYTGIEPASFQEMLQVAQKIGKLLIIEMDQILLSGKTEGHPNVKTT